MNKYMAHELSKCYENPIFFQTMHVIFINVLQCPGFIPLVG